MISWVDYRWHVAHDTCDIYLQRVWENGVLDTLPLPVSNWIGRPAYERDSVNYPLVVYPGNQGGPQPDWDGGSRIIEDGNGGIFAAWHDSRSGLFNIYVQHVTGGGFPYWTEGGIPAGRLSPEVTSRKYPVLTMDGAGGILVFWQESNSMIPYRMICASRLASDGTILWQITLPGALTNQEVPFCIPDGSGGAWVTWQEISYDPTDNSIGVAHVLNDGSAISATIDGPYYDQAPKLALDGVGGVFLAYHVNSPADNGNIFVARVQPDMSIPWTATVCSATGTQHDPWIVASGVGEAVVGWVDQRSPGSWADIYAQKLDLIGDLVWSGWPQGRPVCTATNNQDISFPNNPWIIPDNGGAIIAWEDQRTQPGNVYAQKLDAYGNTQWTLNGVVLCNVKFDGGWGGIVSDDAGGAIACWCDGRDGLPDGGCNIYTQRVYADGSLARPDDACDYRGVFDPNMLYTQRLSALWDMEKENWCLCTSPNLPYPPYVWCGGDFSGTIVAAYASDIGMGNYALICNCMDEQGRPLNPHVYYWGTVPLADVRAVACDDRGPEEFMKSLWWSDYENQLLLHTDLWGNVLNGPFTAEQLGVGDFHITGLATDEVNHHLWALCAGVLLESDVFYEFDIQNPAIPWLLQGAMQVQWSANLFSGAAGLEYNEGAHRLVAVNQQSRTAECFLDNDPPFEGGPLWPGVSFVSACELLEAQRPFGVAVRDGAGSLRLGVMEIIDQRPNGVFPLIGFDPPCAFPSPCPPVDDLTVSPPSGTLVLRWSRVEDAESYNVYHSPIYSPPNWQLVGSTPDSVFVYVPPAVESIGFFKVHALCDEERMGHSDGSVDARCRR